MSHSIEYWTSSPLEEELLRGFGISGNVPKDVFEGGFSYRIIPSAARIVNAGAGLEKIRGCGIMVSQ
jgi:hypothetical protein